MVAIPTTVLLITEDEFAAISKEHKYEIIDGMPVEKMTVGGTHLFIIQNLFRRVDPVVISEKLGYVFTDGLVYLMHLQGKGIKGAFIPDLSFIRKTNLLPDWDVNKNYPGVPDLAVEVISPTDEADEVMLKVFQYMEKGTEQVWLIYPATQTLFQYFRDDQDTVRVYRGDAMIDAEAFFPGVKIMVKELFALPDLGE